MTLVRIVRHETLDGLAESDPRAMRSRRDLRRVNRVMGTRGIVARGFGEAVGTGPHASPLRVLELGAGDGTLMLAVAEGMAGAGVDLTLLDRQRLVDDSTIAGFARVGWQARSLNVDLLDWIAEDHPDRFDAIVTNLFLHHFDDRTLPSVLGAIAGRCNAFFACEPRRALLALGGSHLIGALLVNAVTREDAVLSVHAGFRDDELSRLWPDDAGGWDLREYSAGLFSHCFAARRESR